jgi:pimeloyl-ACP methyl ester carboxylesterase
MPYVSNQGTRIHYEVEGEGPPLVLQHGYTGNLKRWTLHGYVAALRQRHQLILIDARGHGESDKPHDPAAYDLSLRVGDVLAVLDALEVGTAHYWGYSMGGWIGFGMAKYASDRLLSLVIGGAHPYEELLPAYSRLDGSDAEAFFAAFCRRLEIDATKIPAALKKELLANDFRALAAAQADRPSMAGMLPSMTMPCCLYAGEADPRYARVKECAQQITGADFFSIPALDHAAAFREAAPVLPRVAHFLQSRETVV